MKKIPTLFVRDEKDRRFVTEEVTKGCDWVMDGQGIPTRKYDGTCVMKDKDGAWWARRTVKPTQKAPLEFKCIEFDDVTGKMVGWEPIEFSSHIHSFREALEASPTPDAGTYELCGPDINGNPEGLSWAGLVYHKRAAVFREMLNWPSITFERLRDFMTPESFGAEGIVWYHASNDGRMAKLKKKDFPVYLHL